MKSSHTPLLTDQHFLVALFFLCSVWFPLYAKIEVNGDGAHPLYKWLKSQKPGMLGTEAVKWNFTKFLIDRTGQVRKRFAPTDTPENIEKDVALLLAEA